MLVSHTFVADKMDKDRPGPPALDDNMEEEVPSTSVVQEQVSAGDWEKVLIELSAILPHMQCLYGRCQCNYQFRCRGQKAST